MEGVTPPEEIADAWQTRTKFLDKVAAAVDELGAGENLNDPELISNPEASKASETITDFYFDSCG